MNDLSLLKYLLLLIPVLFFWLVMVNKQKARRLKSTGRLPDLDAANRNASLFSAASILSLIGILYLLIS
jgi:hypothetical protein